MTTTDLYKITGSIGYTTIIENHPFHIFFSDTSVKISEDIESNKLLNFSLTHKGQIYNLDSYVRMYDVLPTPTIEEFIERELKIVFQFFLIEKFGVEGINLGQSRIKATIKNTL